MVRTILTLAVLAASLLLAGPLAWADLADLGPRAVAEFRRFVRSLAREAGVAPAGDGTR